MLSFIFGLIVGVNIMFGIVMIIGNINKKKEDIKKKEIDSERQKLLMQLEEETNQQLELIERNYKMQLDLKNKLKGEMNADTK